MYANTGKYNWLLGNPMMSRRIGLIIPRNIAPVPTPCPTCVCCSTDQITKHDAKAIVLCCMDFRLRDNMGCQLNLKGYRNDYDEVIAAGASLGYNGLLSYNQDPSVPWTTYLDQHISLAYDLHEISQIIIIDHEECGAYAKQYPNANPEEIQIRHTENIIACGESLWKKFNPDPETATTNPIKNLEIIGYIISIDGCKLTQLYYKNS
jgi:hypothetical protein